MVILIRVIYVNVFVQLTFVAHRSQAMGTDGPASITLKLRSKNTNNRKYIHNIIFHYLKDNPHRRLNIKTMNIIHMT